MKIKREDLYELLSKICNGSYAIGLHGIDYNRANYFGHSDLEKSLENIISGGLNVYSGRSIHGTVRFFGRIDTEEDKQNVIDGLINYNYGNSNDYIIIAIPIILKSIDGRQLYLGKPNKKSKYGVNMGTTGGEMTSISDSVILSEISNINNTKRINSEFILARFRKLENGNIDLFLNDRHIAFNKGLVSSIFFDYIEKSVQYILNAYNITILFKLNDKNRIDLSILENIDEIDDTIIINVIKTCGLLSKNRRELDCLCETLDQLMNEKNLHKRIIVSPDTNSSTNNKKIL